MRSCLAQPARGAAARLGARRDVEREMVFHGFVPPVTPESGAGVIEKGGERIGRPPANATKTLAGRPGPAPEPQNRLRPGPAGPVSLLHSAPELSQFRLVESDQFRVFPVIALDGENGQKSRPSEIPAAAGDQSTPQRKGQGHEPIPPSQRLVRMDAGSSGPSRQIVCRHRRAAAHAAAVDGFAREVFTRWRTRGSWAVARPTPSSATWNSSKRRPATRRPI